MTTTEAALVSGAVVAMVQLVKWSGMVPARYGPVSVMVWAFLGVAIWAYSAEAFRQANAFELFSGWITVSLASAGIYGFTRAGVESLTRTTPPPSGAGAEPVNLGDQQVDVVTEHLVGRITDRLLERTAAERRGVLSAARSVPLAPDPDELDEPAFLRRGREAP